MDAGYQSAKNVKQCIQSVALSLYPSAKNRACEEWDIENNVPVQFEA